MMRPALTAALLALALVPGTPARAELEVEGYWCNFVELGDVFEVDAGPIAAADVSDLVANPTSATVRCSLQNDEFHAAPDAGWASATGTSVVVLPPTIVEAEVSEWDFYYCTELTVVDARGATTRLYWDDVSSGGEHEWSASADSARCHTSYCDQSYPSNCAPPPCDDSIHLHCDWWPDLNDVLIEQVDPVLCPVLAVLFPPEGDMVLWTCPPYED